MPTVDKLIILCTTGRKLLESTLSNLVLQGKEEDRKYVIVSASLPNEM